MDHLADFQKVVGHKVTNKLWKWKVRKAPKTS